MSEKLITLDGKNFDDVVLASDEPVLVDFSATWCGPCKMLEPTIHELADEAAGKYKVGKLDIDGAPDIAQRFGVRSVPTVLVFKGGEVVETIVGADGKDRYAKALAEAVA